MTYERMGNDCVCAILVGIDRTRSDWDRVSHTRKERQMMKLSNEGIEANVKTIVHAYLQSAKVRPEDKPVIDASVALITNILVNLNDLAWTAVETYDDKTRAR